MTPISINSNRSPYSSQLDIAAPWPVLESGVHHEQHAEVDWKACCS